MHKETIGLQEAGQRFDKYLHKYFTEAPGSFLYKMLRKKNITLNDKKADGTEKLQTGDEIAFFLAVETIEKFRGNIHRQETENVQYKKAYHLLMHRFTILYEDAEILLLNKAAGVLTQKAKEDDLSLNEAMIGYLLATGKLTEETLRTFKPSVCNRLDRNTTGIVICGKSLAGLQKMSELLKERALHKFYHCVVIGQMPEASRLEGYLLKDEKTNQVTVLQHKETGATPIVTEYTPLKIGKKATLLEVKLITGKTHQIRAHLASVGHPILGDHKYGNDKINQRYKEKYLVQSQLLHAKRVEFPVMNGVFSALSERIMDSEVPVIFNKVMEE